MRSVNKAYLMRTAVASLKQVLFEQPEQMHHLAGILSRKDKPQLDRYFSLGDEIHNILNIYRAYCKMHILAG